MIGLTEDTEYKIETYPFEEKDKLILFTDGLIEQFNKQKIEFGEERLYKILLQTRDDQISEQVLYALSQLEKHLEDIELQDDITVIGCEL
jgi:Amt family ammonium transporter